MKNDRFTDHEAMNISAATQSMNQERCMTVNGPPPKAWSRWSVPRSWKSEAMQGAEFRDAWKESSTVLANGLNEGVSQSCSDFEIRRRNFVGATASRSVPTLLHYLLVAISCAYPQRARLIYLGDH